MVQMLGDDGYRLWGWPVTTHTCGWTDDDYRWWLLASPERMGIWVRASEFEFDAFMYSVHPRLSRLFAALWDLGPWFAVCAEDAGEDEDEGEGEDAVGAEAGVVLATGWAPFGLSPVQGATLERAGRLPEEFGAWVDAAIARKWTMDMLVDWAGAFAEPDTADRWIEAGFLRDPWAAREWAFETVFSADAAYTLEIHGVGARGADEDFIQFGAMLRALVGAGPKQWLTVAQREMCQDAVVLASLIPDLGDDDALLFARAGLWDTEEVCAVLDEGPLDRDSLATLAALRS
jgi:hypothetical protein